MDSTRFHQFMLDQIHQIECESDSTSLEDVVGWVEKNSQKFREQWERDHS